MTQMNDHRPVEILLVEDSPSDAALTIEALKAGKNSIMSKMVSRLWNTSGNRVSTSNPPGRI